jgi:hypothetical protein
MRDQGRGRGRGRGIGRGRGRGRGRGCGRGRTHTSQSTREDNENSQIECLPPANTEDVLKTVRAAIYLSLNKLWDVPSELCLVASILDPRLKNFSFAEESSREEQKTSAGSLLKELYIQLKQGSVPPAELSPVLTDDDDIFENMWCDNQSSRTDDDEILRYLQCPVEPKTIDPLKWWQDHRSSYPILAQLARKYLSIPSTSVPSERLFSDAGNHISAKRTRLSPDLVNRILFLKRNSSYFSIFPPLETD